jgi:hypothetical protein
MRFISSIAVRKPAAHHFEPAWHYFGALFGDSIAQQACAMARAKFV